MTPDQKMEIIVVATGQCWHKRVVETVAEREGFSYYPKCNKCEIDLPKGYNNPSPTDLNELFRLAEKLDVGWSVKTKKLGNDRYTASNGGNDICGSTRAEALLNALHEAVKEVAR